MPGMHFSGTAASSNVFTSAQKLYASGVFTRTPLETLDIPSGLISRRTSAQSNQHSKNIHRPHYMCPILQALFSKPFHLTQTDSYRLREER